MVFGSWKHGFILENQQVPPYADFAPCSQCVNCCNKTSQNICTKYKVQKETHTILNLKGVVSFLLHFPSSTHARCDFSILSHI
jgi:hypothetical protein